MNRITDTRHLPMHSCTYISREFDQSWMSCWTFCHWAFGRFLTGALAWASCRIHRSVWQISNKVA